MRSTASHSISSREVHPWTLDWLLQAKRLRDHGWLCTATVVWNVALRAAALSIAFVKGLLVVLYFIHLRDSPRLTWLVVAGTFVGLVILIVGFVEDYWSRSFPGEM